MGKPKGKAGGKGKAPQRAEVDFDSKSEARRMAKWCNGYVYKGSTLEVKVSPTDPTKLLVTGLPPSITPEEIEALFEVPEEEEQEVEEEEEEEDADESEDDKKTSKPQGETAEIRFESVAHAQKAIKKLNKSWYGDDQLAVKADPDSHDGSRILVRGFPQGTAWQDLKDYFGKVGPVVFAAIGKGKGKGKDKGKDKGKGKSNGKSSGGTQIGTVRFDSEKAAAKAVKRLDGSELGGSSIRVHVDRQSSDGLKLVVFGVPSSVHWQELKDHFSSVGTVAFAQVRQHGGGKGKGGESWEESSGDEEDWTASAPKKPKKTKKGATADWEEGWDEEWEEEWEEPPKKKSKKTKAADEWAEWDGEEAWE